MKTLRWLCAIALAVAVAAPSARAQEPPKPGPEHEHLKKMAGDWDLTMKFGGMESKGKVTYKMGLGGLWLMSDLESELLGSKFYGHGMDTYDAAAKKYVSVWFDSMGSRPLTMDGTFDKDKKELTLSGDGPGMDGKPTKYKSVSAMPDDDTINFSMYMGDGKDPAFTITYKRKK
jgi:hypothetical protein